ncbi:polycystic kidney disease type 2 protein [Kipferlia bialata]|uniref:Polycystic kidney disease type 2 protein n=1 Tax=Kipferlia bialata TaxID=797122 RepID=A0A9K3CQU2_9EUKA|nr:polycystic kidney disease type 2 protein [Kipferlia bialata]|eukprot:g1778.t1
MVLQYQNLSGGDGHTHIYTPLDSDGSSSSESEGEGVVGTPQSGQEGEGEGEGVSRLSSSMARHQRELASKRRVRAAPESVKEAKAFLRTFIPYLVFLGLFICEVYIMSRDMRHYYFLRGIDNAMFESTNGSPAANVKPYEEIPDFASYFDWLEGSVSTWLVAADYYNGDPIHEDNIGYALHQSPIFGGLRLRQVRATQEDFYYPDTAEAIGLLDHVFYPDVSGRGHHEDTAMHCGVEWQSAEDLGGKIWRGKVGLYPGSGYVVDIPMDRVTSDSIIAHLKECLWLDESSRLSVLDLTLYNPALDVFLVTRIGMEFPAEGGCVPFHQFKTVDLYRYLRHSDWFRVFVEGLISLYFVKFALDELEEIWDCLRQTSPIREYQDFKHYCSDIWNLVDWINILLFAAIVGIRVHTVLVTRGLMEAVQADETAYVNFEPVAYTMVYRELSLVGALCFMTMFKSFKFFAASPRLSILTRTMTAAAKDLVAFGFVFIVVFLGFGMAGHVVYGGDMFEFSNMGQTMLLLFRWICGDFDFMEMYWRHRVFTCIYFVSFMSLCYLLLLNMLVAILIDAFTEVRKNPTFKRDNMLKLASAIVRQKLVRTLTINGRIGTSGHSRPTSPLAADQGYPQAVQVADSDAPELTETDTSSESETDTSTHTHTHSGDMSSINDRLAGLEVSLSLLLASNASLTAAMDRMVQRERKREREREEREVEARELPPDTQ